MGNYLATKAEVRNYLFARVPLVMVKTSERERVERMMRELAEELKAKIWYYTDVKQAVPFYSGANEKKRDVDRDPLSFAQELFRKGRGNTLVIGDARRINEENSFSRELLDTLYLAMETAGTIVLVTPDYVWNRLAQFGLLTILDYPDASERENQIRQFVERYRNYRNEWSSDDIHRAVMLLRGFTEVQIDNVLISVMVSSQGLKSSSLTELTKQKSRLYAAVPCVDEVQVSPDIRISGLDRLRQWVRERKMLFFISDDILKSRCLTAPKGILLAGVPGCGKSFSAKMIAAEWGLPLFRFDIGAIYDKWMGESERKMNDALSFIDNMAPCIVWIDEIEKALSVSDTGNDTGKRILGQFLYWLQESESRVFLVATANDVSELPPELFRKGRFSEIFYIDLPNRTERKEAIGQYLESCLHICLRAEELERLVELSDGFSYSDIESVIKDAAQQLLLNPQCVMTFETIRDYFKNNNSFSRSNPDAVAQLRQWGRERAVPASYASEN